MVKDNKEDSILLEDDNLVVEGTDNQKDNKKEISKSAQRTEQNLTNTDVANNQNLQYEQGTIQELRDSGDWYKKSRAEKKEIRKKIAEEENKKAREEAKSKFVEQKEEDSDDKESGPNDSQKQFDALQGKKLEPQYIADNNEIQRDDIMNKELNKNLDVAKENNEKVLEEQKKKQEELEKKKNNK